MDLVQIIVSANIKNPFTCMVFEKCHDFKSIAHALLNTKALKISTASQLKLTADNFGQVMISKGNSDAAGWCPGVNVIKDGVGIDDFKNLQLPLARSHFGVPQKKMADIKKMLPFLDSAAKLYFEEILEDSPNETTSLQPTEPGTSRT